MISLSEYAAQQHISYEAVRQQVARYQENELKGHISRKGRTRYLDDAAVDFLNSHRQEALGLGSSIGVVNDQLQRELDTLKQEYITLNREYTAALKEITRLMEERRETEHLLADTNTKLLAATTEREQDHLQAIAEANSLREELQEQTAQNDLTKQKLAQAVEELQAEKRRAEAAEEASAALYSEYQAEQNRRISFSEFWHRRKNK